MALVGIQNYIAGTAFQSPSASVAAAVTGATTARQIVSTTFRDTFATTVGSFIDVPGFSVAITPLSASSTLLIFGHIIVSATAGSTMHRILCNQVEIYPVTPSTNRFSGYMEYANADANTPRNSPFIFVHTPGTRDRQIYQLQIKGNDGAANTYTVNRSGSDAASQGYAFRSASNITVMEITT